MSGGNASPESVPITSLAPAQLSRVRDQLVNEVEELVEGHAQLGRLAGRSAAAASAVEALAEAKPDQPLLLPLTPSLYVKGTLANTERVLVNVGTDYFVEMSTEKATDFCRRKQQLLQREQSAVQKEVASRRNALGQVTAVLQDKVRALQASGS